MASIFTAEGSRFVRFHEKWMALSAKISGLMVLVIAVLTLIDIIGRSTGLYTLLGVYEVCMYILIWLCFIGVAYAHKIGSNIRVELVYSRLGPKGQDILLLIALGVGIYVFSNVFYSNASFTMESITTREIISGIPYWRVPFWPIKFAIPFGIFFLLVEFVLDVARIITRLRGGEV